MIAEQGLAIYDTSSSLSLIDLPQLYKSILLEQTKQYDHVIDSLIDGCTQFPSTILSMPLTSPEGLKSTIPAATVAPLLHASAIILTASPHVENSLERVTSYWLPLLHILGCTQPVIIAPNTVDLPDIAQQWVQLASVAAVHPWFLPSTPVTYTVVGNNIGNIVNPPFRNSPNSHNQYPSISSTITSPQRASVVPLIRALTSYDFPSQTPLMDFTAHQPQPQSHAQTSNTSHTSTQSSLSSAPVSSATAALASVPSSLSARAATMNVLSSSSNNHTALTSLSQIAIRNLFAAAQRLASQPPGILFRKNSRRGVFPNSESSVGQSLAGNTVEQSFPYQPTVRFPSDAQRTSLSFLNGDNVYNSKKQDSNFNNLTRNMMTSPNRNNISENDFTDFPENDHLSEYTLRYAGNADIDMEEDIQGFRLDPIDKEDDIGNNFTGIGTDVQSQVKMVYHWLTNTQKNGNTGSLTDTDELDQNQSRDDGNLSMQEDGPSRFMWNNLTESTQPSFTIPSISFFPASVTAPWLASLASRSLDIDVITALRRLFMLFDEDNDGTLNYFEFSLLMGVLNPEFSRNDVSEQNSRENDEKTPFGKTNIQLISNDVFLALLDKLSTLQTQQTSTITTMEDTISTTMPLVRYGCLTMRGFLTLMHRIAADSCEYSTPIHFCREYSRKNNIPIDEFPENGGLSNSEYAFPSFAFGLFTDGTSSYYPGASLLWKFLSMSGYSCAASCLTLDESYISLESTPLLALPHTCPPLATALSPLLVDNDDEEMTTDATIELTHPINSPENNSTHYITRSENLTLETKISRALIHFLGPLSPSLPALASLASSLQALTQVCSASPVALSTSAVTFLTRYFYSFSCNADVSKNQFQHIVTTLPIVPLALDTEETMDSSRLSRELSKLTSSIVDEERQILQFIHSYQTTSTQQLTPSQSSYNLISMRLSLASAQLTPEDLNILHADAIYNEINARLAGSRNCDYVAYYHYLAKNCPQALFSDSEMQNSQLSSGILPNTPQLTLSSLPFSVLLLILTQKYQDTPSFAGFLSSLTCSPFSLLLSPLPKDIQQYLWSLLPHVSISHDLRAYNSPMTQSTLSLSSFSAPISSLPLPSSVIPAILSSKSVFALNLTSFLSMFAIFMKEQPHICAAALSQLGYCVDGRHRGLTRYITPAIVNSVDTQSIPYINTPSSASNNIHTNVNIAKDGALRYAAISDGLITSSVLPQANLDKPYHHITKEGESLFIRVIDTSNAQASSRYAVGVSLATGDKAVQQRAFTERAQLLNQVSNGQGGFGVTVINQEMGGSGRSNNPAQSKMPLDSHAVIRNIHNVFLGRKSPLTTPTATDTHVSDTLSSPPSTWTSLYPFLTLLSLTASTKSAASNAPLSSANRASSSVVSGVISNGADALPPLPRLHMGAHATMTVSYHCRDDNSNNGEAMFRNEKMRARVYRSSVKGLHGISQPVANVLGNKNVPEANLSKIISNISEQMNALPIITAKRSKSVSASMTHTCRSTPVSVRALVLGKKGTGKTLFRSVFLKLHSGNDADSSRLPSLSSTSLVLPFITIKNDNANEKEPLDPTSTLPFPLPPVMDSGKISWWNFSRTSRNSGNPLISSGNTHFPPLSAVTIPAHASLLVPQTTHINHSNPARHAPNITPPYSNIHASSTVSPRPNHTHAHTANRLNNGSNQVHTTSGTIGRPLYTLRLPVAPAFLTIDETTLDLDVRSTVTTDDLGLGDETLGARARVDANGEMNGTMNTAMQYGALQSPRDAEAVAPERGARCTDFCQQLTTTLTLAGHTPAHALYIAQTIYPYDDDEQFYHSVDAHFTSRHRNNLTTNKPSSLPPLASILPLSPPSQLIAALLTSCALYGCSCAAAASTQTVANNTNLTLSSLSPSLSSSSAAGSAGSLPPAPTPTPYDTVLLTYSPLSPSSIVAVSVLLELLPAHIPRLVLQTHTDLLPDSPFLPGADAKLPPLIPITSTKMTKTSTKMKTTTASRSVMLAPPFTSPTYIPYIAATLASLTYFTASTALSALFPSPATVVPLALPHMDAIDMHLLPRLSSATVSYAPAFIGALESYISSRNSLTPTNSLIFSRIFAMTHTPALYCRPQAEGQSDAFWSAKRAVGITAIASSVLMMNLLFKSQTTG